MTDRDPNRRRFPLRYLLFFALLLSGIIPLVLFNLLVIGKSRDALEAQERTFLVASAGSLSNEIGASLRALRMQLELLGGGLLGGSGGEAVGARLREPWVQSYLEAVMSDNAPDLLALRVLDRKGAGPRIAFRPLSQPDEDALNDAFTAALEEGGPIYGFAVRPLGGEPVAALAVPVGTGGEAELVVEGLIQLSRLQEEFRGEIETAGGSGLFLMGRDGEILWSRGLTPEMEAELLRSELVQDFVRRPLRLSGQYALETGGERQEFLVRVSPVDEAGWGVVVQRPLAAAFEFIDRLVFSTVLFSLLLVALALFFAVYFARRFSQPIQRMAETSHEIAAGNFGRRVEVGGLSRELADLAEDFNQMSGHVEGYVARLEEAARVNRELFIGSLRAFAAAIDAKDPCTRGHSERVASLARTIARNLSLPEEVQHQVWIGALLHDVGKLGIDDSILKKGGALTPEEYELMKAHPVIGAEILSPIEQLREMIPVVRSHHEGWNGRGYPDGLKGDAIPLAARIVAVADTFDAITTSRPYQEGYTLEFALETLRRQAGSRFDAKIVSAFLHAYERGEVRAVRSGSVRYDRAAEARVAGLH